MRTIPLKMVSGTTLYAEHGDNNVRLGGSLPPPPSTVPQYEVTCTLEKDRWDKFKPFLEIAGVLILSVYTFYTIKMYSANKRAADAATDAAIAAKTAAIAASDQVTLMQRQLGMQEAWVQVIIGPQNTCCDPQPKPQFGWPSGINISIINRGQTVASDVHVSLSVDLRYLDKARPIKQHLLKPNFTIPRVESGLAPVIGFANIPPVYKTFPIVLSPEDRNDINGGRLSIVSDGSVSYNTVFGKTKSEHVCWVYWINYSVDKTGQVSSDGGAPLTCQDFDAMRPQIPRDYKGTQGSPTCPAVAKQIEERKNQSPRSRQARFSR